MLPLYEGLLATAVVGEEGWLELLEPIVVRAGEPFVAVPESTPLGGQSPGKILLHTLAVAAVLASTGTSAVWCEAKRTNSYWRRAVVDRRPFFLVTVPLLWLSQPWATWQAHYARENRAVYQRCRSTDVGKSKYASARQAIRHPASNTPNNAITRIRNR